MPASLAPRPGQPRACRLRQAPEGGQEIGLSCADDGAKAAYLWDIKGRKYRRLEGHIAEVTCVATSSDGLRALTGSLDQTIRLWDLKTRKEIHRFDGHSAQINCVVFSADGRQALSASSDQTVRLWQLPK